EGITILDIISTRMLGQYGFLAKVFSVMKDNEISVDVVATSEVSVSLTLDPAKLWSRNLREEELDNLVQSFVEGGIARVTVKTGYTIISLICNVLRSSAILERAFRALDSADINVIMMSQGASKVNISLIVDESSGAKALEVLHEEFF
ncbi:hypothetical protein CYMTET_18549, partial [Cymbomonas tetramitiformis]